MINYVLKQYQILINKGYRQAFDGSWHKELEEYILSKKEMPDNRELLTRHKMQNLGYLTNDFLKYYSSAESFLKYMSDKSK